MSLTVPRGRTATWHWDIMKIAIAYFSVEPKTVTGTEHQIDAAVAAADQNPEGIEVFVKLERRIGTRGPDIEDLSQTEEATQSFQNASPLRLFWYHRANLLLSTFEIHKDEQWRSFGAHLFGVTPKISSFLITDRFLP